MYSKVLVTKDFQFTKVVFQEPGKPAMEMPFGNEMGKSHLKEEMAKWHQVGSETITVPAGTFGCLHWKNEDGSDEVWTSDKVTPMAMVKQVGKSGSMVLTKIITGASDHITGPVTKFDPEALRKQYQNHNKEDTLAVCRGRLRARLVRHTVSDRLCGSDPRPRERCPPAH